MAADVLVLLDLEEGKTGVYWGMAGLCALCQQVWGLGMGPLNKAVTLLYYCSGVAERNTCILLVWDNLGAWISLCGIGGESRRIHMTSHYTCDVTLHE